MTERPEFSRRTHVAELIAVAAIVFVIVMGTAHIEPEAQSAPSTRWLTCVASAARCRCCSGGGCRR